MVKWLFIGLLFAQSMLVSSQPVDVVIGDLERQYNAKVISVQERRGGYRVRMLQRDGVVKTINYRPDNWQRPDRPRFLPHETDRREHDRHESERRELDDSHRQSKSQRD